MTRLTWGANPPEYDYGVDQGVLYLDDTGVPWNGLVSVDERDTGTVNVEHYFDGNRLHVSQDNGNFEATISAYTYPDAFAEYNGFSDREEYRRFGFSYRTQRRDGYRLHLVYNVLVLDNDRSWSSISERADPSLFNWDISGASEPVPGASPSSRLMVESTRADVLAQLEDILYGTHTTAPRLPSPAEVVGLYESSTLMRVTYNGDGTYTISGPDSMVAQLTEGRFEIDAPTAFLLGEGVFTVRSY